MNKKIIVGIASDKKLAGYSGVQHSIAKPHLGETVNLVACIQSHTKGVSASFSAMLKTMLG